MLMSGMRSLRRTDYQRQNQQKRPVLERLGQRVQQQQQERQQGQKVQQEQRPDISLSSSLSYI
jgi:hypothetical protein